MIPFFIFTLLLGLAAGHEVGARNCKNSTKQVASADANQDTTTDEEVYARVQTK